MSEDHRVLLCGALSLCDGDWCHRGGRAELLITRRRILPRQTGVGAAHGTWTIRRPPAKLAGAMSRTHYLAQ